MSSRMKTGVDRFADKGRQTSIRVRQERARQRAAELAPVITELQAGGAATLQAIADGLNRRGVMTARGNSWTPTQVRRVLALVDLRAAGWGVPSEWRPSPRVTPTERPRGGKATVTDGQLVR